MSLATALVIVREAVRSRINPQINHLILHITNLCNFRCNHCFVDFQESPIDLTLDEIRSIAEDVPPLIWLDIGGGEPFLRRDIHEIIASHNYSTKSSGFMTIKPLYVVGEALKIRVSNNLSKCGGISPLLSGWN